MKGFYEGESLRRSSFVEVAGEINNLMILLCF